MKKLICVIALLSLIPVLYGQVGKNKNDSTRGNGDSASIEKNMMSSPKKRPKPIEVIFDETGHQIGFPKPVITESDRVVFIVKMDRSTFAGQVNVMFKKMDSVFDYFLKYPENQASLWALFNNIPSTKQWLEDLDQYRGYEQNIADRFYDLSNYDSSIETSFIQKARDLKYFPLHLYYSNLVYQQFKIRLYMGGNAPFHVLGNYSIKPMFHPDHFRKHQEDCIWWYSDTLDLEKLTAGGCRDCGSEVRFAMTYNDPFNKTVAEWYDQKFKLVDSTLAGKDRYSHPLQKKLDELQRLDAGLTDDTIIDATSFVYYSLPAFLWEHDLVRAAENKYTDFLQSCAGFDTMNDSVKRSVRNSIEQLYNLKKLAFPFIAEARAKVIQGLKAETEDDRANNVPWDIAFGNIVNRAATERDRVTNALASNVTFIPFQDSFATIRTRLGRLTDKTGCLGNITGFIDRNGLVFYEYASTKPEQASTDKYSSLFSSIRQLQPWLIYWLWYNKGLLVINPAPSIDDKWLKPQKDYLKKLTRELEEQKQRKAFLDSTIVHSKKDLRHYKELETIQDEQDNLTSQMEVTNKKVEDQKKVLASDSTVKALQTISKRTYVGLLPVGCKTCIFDPDGPKVSKQFTYLEDKGRIGQVYSSEGEKRRVVEIPENENTNKRRAQITIHNIPTGAKVSVTQSLTGFDDTELFTQLVLKALKSIDSSGIRGTALLPNLINLSNFAHGIVDKPARSTDAEKVAKSIGLNAGIDQPGKDQITANYVNRSAMNAPVILNTYMGVNRQIDKKTDTLHSYLTRSYDLTDSLAPYQVNVAIQIDSAKGKGIVQVGKLRRIQLAAGLAIVSRPASQTFVDTSGNGFKVSSSDNSAQVILGLKIYPWKSYNRDDEIIPRYPLRRFSFMAAVSIPKAFNNFYLGAGYDVVPGLTLSVGGSIYKQTFYQVQNAQIINSQTRYQRSGTYYALTVNPVILAEFVKLFFN